MDWPVFSVQCDAHVKMKIILSPATTKNTNTAVLFYVYFLIFDQFCGCDVDVTHIHRKIILINPDTQSIVADRINQKNGLYVFV